MCFRILFKNDGRATDTHLANCSTAIASISLPEIDAVVGDNPCLRTPEFACPVCAVMKFDVGLTTNTSGTGDDRADVDANIDDDDDGAFFLKTTAHHAITRRPQPTRSTLLFMAGHSSFSAVWERHPFEFGGRRARWPRQQYTEEVFQDDLRDGHAAGLPHGWACGQPPDAIVRA
jgi:hypothetical protein